MCRFAGVAFISSGLMTRCGHCRLSDSGPSWTTAEIQSCTTTDRTESEWDLTRYGRFLDISDLIGVLYEMTSPLWPQVVIEHTKEQSDGKYGSLKLEGRMSIVHRNRQATGPDRSGISLPRRTVG